MEYHGLGVLGEIRLLPILFINRLSSSFSPDSSGCYSPCSKTAKHRILKGLFFVKIKDLCLSQALLCLMAKEISKSFFLGA